MPEQPVIVAAKRTPVGRFFGGLSNVPSPQLGAYAIEAMLGEAPQIRDHIEEVIMGCVLQGGLGQNPARQAALKAGLPDTINAHTTNKVCGSGLKSVMLAAQAIKAGDAHCIVAGGFENMTAGPHFAYVRTGVKYGPTEFKDMMAHDGLTCAFEDWMMGDAADHIARKYDVSREDQDAFAVASHQKAAAATEKGWFSSEYFSLTPEQCMQRKGSGIGADEGIRADTTIEAVAKLRPAFAKDGTVTAGNASQISDGGAAIGVMSESKAKELGVTPMARIVAYGSASVTPKDIFYAPVPAVQQTLEKAGMTVGDIDLFELNEAFAAQSLCNVRALEVPEEKVNICGGAIAIGHPIGCSGARVFTTLLHQLRRTGGTTGLASLCLGGGSAVVMIVEMV
jgi:acetyl-CoA C-acetyltransferase